MKNNNSNAFETARQILGQTFITEPEYMAKAQEAIGKGIEILGGEEKSHVRRVRVQGSPSNGYMDITMDTDLGVFNVSMRTRPQLLRVDETEEYDYVVGADFNVNEVEFHFPGGCAGQDWDLFKAFMSAMRQAAGMFFKAFDGIAGVYVKITK